MKNIQLNNRSLQNLSAALRHFFYSLPSVALIERFRLLRLILLVVAGGVALYVVVQLLYVESGSAPTIAPRPAALQADSLDELEVWLEERHAEWEREIIDGRRQYFER